MKIKHGFLFCLSLIAVLVTGCAGTAAPQKNQSTVSVYGIGTVLVKPDMLQMGISLSNTAETTRAAQEEVNRMVTRALETLKNSGIADNNISTASLSFSPEYEYESGRRVLTGQKAEQSITFSVEDIETNSEKVSQIIDRLIQINGIELNRFNFSVKNNTEHFIKSRELAYQKALQKAEQYAALSNQKIAGALSITEEGNRQIQPLSSNVMITQMEYAADGSSRDDSTVLPAGELEITTRILAVFLLE